MFITVSRCFHICMQYTTAIHATYLHTTYICMSYINMYIIYTYYVCMHSLLYLCWFVYLIAFTFNFAAMHRLSCYAFASNSQLSMQQHVRRIRFVWRSVPLFRRYIHTVIRICVRVYKNSAYTYIMILPKYVAILAASLRINFLIPREIADNLGWQRIFLIYNFIDFAYFSFSCTWFILFTYTFIDIRIYGKDR